MLFRSVPPAHTLVRGVDGSRLRRHTADSTWPPLWPTGSSSGWPPSITARSFSSSPSDSTSRWTPCPPRPPSPGPARHYPRFRIWRPPSERQGDFNPPEHVAAWHTVWADPTSPRPHRRAWVCLALRPPAHRPGRREDLPGSVRFPSLRADGCGPGGRGSALARASGRYCLPRRCQRVGLHGVGDFGAGPVHARASRGFRPTGFLSTLRPGGYPTRRKTRSQRPGGSPVAGGTPRLPVGRQVTHWEAPT